jgi:hypothetical protein
MSATLPIPNTTTCDIYRFGNSPPAAPDVAGVKIALAPRGQSTLTTNNYTHVAYVPWSTDIRHSGNAPGQLSLGTQADTIYVPDKTGVAYGVVLVRRINRGGAMDMKQVILQLQPLTWPTNNV